MAVQLEICANSFHSALLAETAGADRIELCDNLAEGGTTPSIGLVMHCLEQLSIPVFPIIRPRAGGFVYDAAEIKIMRHEIRAFRKAGVKGLVLGALTKSLEVDINCCKDLLQESEGLEVTFHRAIDLCTNPEHALNILQELGFKRVLTSGGKATALEGIQLLKKFSSMQNLQLEIVAGSGINSQNVGRLLTDVPALAGIHTTAKKSKHNTNSMFPDSNFDTDPNEVKSLKDLLRHHISS